MPDIFLSYSRRNRRFIDRLVADLEDHGIEVWQDVLELGVGDPVHKSIESAISESRFFASRSRRPPCAPTTSGTLNLSKLSRGR
ncbi:toll/interleukin-1 receptor domain-containing protein [Micromonospora zamorensis]|uniref:toll/interleukin-1 receptor domain-containing protein n=1 Tax=Micromonospora zamorensis TaxID=709883 RepID=UPI0033E42302